MNGAAPLDARAIEVPPLTRWLAAAPDWVLNGYAALTGFATYFCMYAFRKPFTVARFKGATFLGTKIELTTALVIGQIVGYALSKYLGIKICSETTRSRRARTLFALIVAAEVALLAFAVLPDDWRVLAIFVNGLPLGMVWGLCVRYLEGRRASEVLLACLACSFVVSSGVVKDVGAWLLSPALGVSEAWMPFATGLLFLPLFFAAAWLLDQLPEPTPADELARSRREPMNHARRAQFLREFIPGLAPLFVVYFFLTAYRDFRDNFGKELLDQLGYGDRQAIFTRTELPIALSVLAALAALNLVRSNRLGLWAMFAMMTAGMLLLGGATWLYCEGTISGLAWMAFVGLGTYLTYVPHNSVLFDRLLAATQATGTAVFAIYVADALGYTGSIGLLLVKDVVVDHWTRLDFFIAYSYFMAVVGATCIVVSGAYFLARAQSPERRTDDQATPTD